MLVGVLGGDAGGAEGEIHERKLLYKVSRKGARAVWVEGISNVSAISLLPVSVTCYSPKILRVPYLYVQNQVYTRIYAYT